MRFQTLCLSLLALAAFGPAQEFSDQAVGANTTTADPNIRIEQKLGSKLSPTAEFKDQNGKAVHFGELLTDRPAVLLPIFYRCGGVCAVETHNLIDTLGKLKTKKVGKDYDVIVVSIDPQEGVGLAKDKFKTAVLSNPAFQGTEPGWHLLTGTLTNIRQITDALGFYYTYNVADDVINHPSGIMFLTPSGTVSSYILGPTYTPDAVTKNLDLAAKSQVGQKSQDILFGCVHVDPLTGKRSLVIEKVLKVVGAIFLVVMVGGIFTLSRRKARNFR